MIGSTKKSIDSVASLISDVDKHFLCSMNTSLLTEFGLHKAVQVFDMFNFDFLQIVQPMSLKCFGRWWPLILQIWLTSLERNRQPLVALEEVNCGRPQPSRRDQKEKGVSGGHCYPPPIKIESSRQRDREGDSHLHR